MDIQNNQLTERFEQNKQEYPMEQENHSYNKSQSDFIINCLFDLRNEIQKLTQMITTNHVLSQKEYYSIKEFAKIIERSEFTVREYCRKGRINAEKCDSGRGSNQNWKISSQELNYFKSHGLRPMKYG